jgi:hypothetical protein
LDSLAARLKGLAAERADLAVPLESALRSLERLGQGSRTHEETENSLARLDRRLPNALLDALAPAERDEIAGRVAALLEPARGRMDVETAEKTGRALTRRLLREELRLPRLTLLA